MNCQDTAGHGPLMRRSHTPLHHGTQVHFANIFNWNIGDWDGNAPSVPEFLQKCVLVKGILGCVKGMIIITLLYVGSMDLGVACVSGLDWWLIVDMVARIFYSY